MAGKTIVARVAVACASLGLAGALFSYVLPTASATDTGLDEVEPMVVEALTQSGVARSEVAAVVNGQVITQSEVDALVSSEKARSIRGGEKSWDDYLAKTGQTEWDVRSEALKELIDDVLMSQAAENLGIEVSDDEVAAAVASVEDLYPSHDAFLVAIYSNGYTEESYSSAIRRQLLKSHLSEAVIPVPEPTDDQIADYARTVMGGMVTKRSSMILIPQGSYNMALEVQQLLMEGADFAEVASDYSVDGSAVSGGDAGWDCLASFPVEYSRALDELEPGEISSIIGTRFGFYIIKCTDEYEVQLDADGDIALGDIPSDIMDSIKYALSQRLSQLLFGLYIDNLEASTTIAVFNADGDQVAPEEVGLSTEKVFNPSIEALMSELVGPSANKR